LGSLFHLDGGNIHTYHRMIQHMDEGIGWVVEALRKTQQLDNTLIVFTSDNGGERFSDNWPLVGGKMDLTEGGIRVPWVAHWPSVIPAGSVSAQPCMTMDWSATLLDVGGGTPHPDYPLDGVSLSNVLRAPEHTFERPLFWRMNHRQQRAMRLGDWKYLKVDQHEYLFHLASDERERANLAMRERGRFEAMRHQYLQWEATIPPIPDDAAVSTGYSTQDMPQR
jgi:arylsulfatase A-like enzyme